MISKLSKNPLVIELIKKVNEIIDNKLDINDISLWAKQPLKPKYTKEEVGLGNVDNTADSEKNVKNANTVNNLSVLKAVPADAKFTDTTYAPMVAATNDTVGKEGLVPAPDAGKNDSFLRGDGTWAKPTPYDLQPATGDEIGGVIIGPNISNENGTISLNKDNVTNALGFEPLSTDGGMIKGDLDVTGKYLVNGQELESGINLLKRNTTYTVGTICFSPKINSKYHLKCITEGTTDTNDPISLTNTLELNTTIEDGTVVWQVFAYISNDENYLYVGHNIPTYLHENMIIINPDEDINVESALEEILESKTSAANSANTATAEADKAVRAAEKAEQAAAGGIKTVDGIGPDETGNINTEKYVHPESGVQAGTYSSVTVDTSGHVTGGSAPITLDGYGITDAKILNGEIILGENKIKPLTQHQDLSGYAPLVSPAFTDTPTTPTAVSGTNTNQIANTAFVQQEIKECVKVSAENTFTNSNTFKKTITTTVDFQTYETVSDNKTLTADSANWQIVELTKDIALTIDNSNMVPGKIKVYQIQVTTGIVVGSGYKLSLNSGGDLISSPIYYPNGEIPALQGNQGVLVTVTVTDDLMHGIFCYVGMVCNGVDE